MRRVPESEVENQWERDIPWGDDERHYYHPRPKKTSVVTYFLRLNCVLDLVSKYVKNGARVGDFACGQGNYGLLLAERGYEVTAADIHDGFLKYAKKKYTHGSFQTILANIIDYRDEQGFDALLLGEVIEHVAFPKQLLAAAGANLKPGGHLFLTTPNGAEFASPLPTFSQVKDITALIPKQFHWGDHLFLYTAEELRSLLNEAGFDTLEIHKINSSYVSQIKAIRFLMPLKVNYWLDRKARSLPRKGKDSTNSLVVVAKKRF